MVIQQTTATDVPYGLTQADPDLPLFTHDGQLASFSIQEGWSEHVERASNVDPDRPHELVIVTRTKH
jgi:hypothetical protein